jgi:hypothetical protein
MNKITWGFWRQYEKKRSDDMYPELPFPEPNLEKWDGQDEFVQNMKKRQNKLGLIRYRGFSTCRICKCSNGTGTYDTGKAEWPEGALHYVEKHNVKPSQEFIDFINGVK